jgi:very-short-patch-repair endonuclease
MLPGLYSAAECAESLYTRAHAATRWVGATSVLIGIGAASVWGECDSPPDVVRVSAPHGTHRTSPPWLRVCRTATVVPSSDWVQCAIATPAWAAITAYMEAPHESRDRLIYRAVQRGLATPTEIAGVAESLTYVHGRRQLMRALTAASAGAESHLEAVALRHVFSTSEFSRFVRQHKILVKGSAFRLDMFDPLTRTAIELDGVETHVGVGPRARDVKRDALLASTGILTLRFTYASITANGDWCRDVVRETLASRAPTMRGAWVALDE